MRERERERKRERKRERDDKKAIAINDSQSVHDEKSEKMYKEKKYVYDLESLVVICHLTFLNCSNLDIPH